jgi:C1A family cysteine protease
MSTHGYVYNQKKNEQDQRDFKFMVSLAEDGVLSLPVKFDLRKTGCVPPVLDQLALGSCCPNELSNAMKFCLKKKIQETDANPKTLFQPSRLYMYYFARIVDGSSVLEDTGITIKGGMKAIQKYGCCTEVLLPYDITQFTRRPSIKCCMDARRHSLNFQYLFVDQTLDLIKQAILLCPVVLGILIYETFESENCIETGKIPMPNIETEQLLGGHCVALYGWNDENKTFLMMNSWGTTVGDKGYFYIPYDYVLDNNLAWDLVTIKMFE